jgi:hypothetical protein
MGRVAWLILLVVVSVFVVFCVLCFLQNNPVFSSVTIFHILKNENYELCFLAGFFVNQTTTGKNYDRKKGWPDDCTFFFTVVIFSGCNLNPLKNIAGQTTVRFFSVVTFPPNLSRLHWPDDCTFFFRSYFFWL